VITTEHIHPNKSHGHCRGNKACSGKNVLSHGDPPLWLLPALLVCRVSSNRVAQDMAKTPGAASGFYTKNDSTARLRISRGPRGGISSETNCRVVVSFGMGSLSKRRSFPRKRESSPSTAHFRRFAE
jgi:hypothetical protein